MIIFFFVTENFLLNCKIVHNTDSADSIDIIEFLISATYVRLDVNSNNIDSDTEGSDDIEITDDIEANDDIYIILII